MARIKDYTEEHPMDKFSWSDKPKDNPFVLKWEKKLEEVKKQIYAQRENPYEVTKPDVAHKVCDNHDITYALIGEKCPRCKRLSLFSYEN